MTKGNSEELTKKKIYSEIEQIRSEAQADSKLRMRTQDEILQLLKQALKCLEENESESSLNCAAFKIAMARCRKLQADNQNMWTSVVICIWGIITLTFSVYAIVKWQLWPQTEEMGLNYILLGSVVWGLLGSSLDGLRELHTRYARQELDSNRIFWYIAHPVIGGGLGAILFLLVFAGLLAVGQAESTAGGFNPSLPFVLSALSGFEQKNVIWFLRDTIAQILHIPEREPHEAG